MATTTVAAVFDDDDGVRDALERLDAERFDRDRISVLGARETRGKRYGIVERSKGPEGMAAGGVAGGVVGAVIGGIASAMALPESMMVTVGSIVAALAGAGLGAMLGGSIGFVVGRSIPEHEAKLFGEDADEAGVLVGVAVDDAERARVAAGTMETAGASQITRH